MCVIFKRTWFEFLMYGGAMDGENDYYFMTEENGKSKLNFVLLRIEKISNKKSFVCLCDGLGGVTFGKLN